MKQSPDLVLWCIQSDQRLKQINKAVVKLVGSMSHVRNVFSGCESISGMYVFSVLADQGQPCLKGSNNSPLGLLDAHTTSACQLRIADANVTFEVLLKVSLCQSVVLRSKKPSEATLPADINVYGSYDRRDAVDSVVSYSKLYLQHPVYGTEFYEFSTEEHQQYDATEVFMEQMIKRRASERSAKNNPFNRFQAQLQLRTLCNHGSFRKRFPKNPSRDLELEREAIFSTLVRNGMSSVPRVAKWSPY
jgi:hypothetical protein